MAKIELTIPEVRLLLAALGNTRSEYNLKDMAGPSNSIPGMTKMLGDLDGRIRDQIPAAELEATE